MANGKETQTETLQNNENDEEYGGEIDDDDDDFPDAKVTPKKETQ